MWNEFLAPPGYVAQNYQPKTFIYINPAANNYAPLAAYGTKYFAMQNQQPRLIPTYQKNQYVQLRHYIVDKLVEAFLTHPEEFIEGDLGEVRESFMSLDQML